MKRKVIKQANQAYTITLPIDWVRKNRINENSEVELTIHEKDILINSKNPFLGGSATLNLKDFSDKMIYNHIVALYAKGYDEIIINSEIDISNYLTKTLNSLMGYALISQSQGKYIIKDLNFGNYPNLDEIFKRVFQMVLFFYESAINDIYGGQKETLESLKARDLEVNKFCLYLQRAINKQSYPNPLMGRILFTYSFELERIGDEIERLWRTNIKYGPTKTKEMKEITILSKEGLDKAFDIFYRYSIDEIAQIYKLRDKVRDKSLLLKKQDPNSTRFIRHIVKIVEDAADLNHLALQKHLI